VKITIYEFYDKPVEDGDFFGLSLVSSSDGINGFERLETLCNTGGEYIIKANGRSETV